MITKLVNVRLPETLYATAKNLLDVGGYANFQELMKDALRRTVQEIQKNQALLVLEKNYGSMRSKSMKPFTKEIRDQIAERLAERVEKEFQK